MDKETLKRLELNKVIKRLAGLCTSSLGREKASLLVPSSSIEAISKWQLETTEAAEVFRIYPTSVPLGGIPDLRPQLAKAGRGINLDPNELLAVGDFLSCIRRMSKFLKELRDDFPILKEAGRRLNVIPQVESEIQQAIKEDGSIADNASPKLARLRKQIRATENRIKEKLDSILQSSYYEKMLQERLITIRNERYVIPIKQEFRNQLQGLVHDQSASGATLFMEPMPVVMLNNDLRQLRAAEQKEIEAILTRLTELVLREREKFLLNLETAGWLDFVFAKGRLSRELDAVKPEFNEEGFIRICGGRHPLLSNEVVPISVELGGKFDVLVITGPNTGGKTVTLKTIGLLTCMAQCGLHIPAEPGTEIGVFKNIYADIGDEQSIEQSLSTFSSHMKNIVAITQRADRESLVLLDELGAGTDPAEGSALAMAILEHLRCRKAKVVATTHYSRLKTYAYTQKGVENASMEFDARTLKPTYRLLTGIPGRSNAFEIAQRLGLLREIVEKGRELMHESELEVESLISGLTEKHHRASEEEKRAQELRKRLEEQLEKLRQKEKDLMKAKEEILGKAYEEAKAIMSESRREARGIINELRKRLKNVENKEDERAAQKSWENISHMERRLLEETRNIGPKDIGSPPENLSAGQQVFIPKLNKKGVVLTEPGVQGDVQVRAGNLKINVNLSDLRLLEPTSEAERELNIKTGSYIKRNSKSISPKLDIRGERVEEALEKVDKYLDEAFLEGLSEVCLIHGKGSGVLRSAITEFLSEHQQVMSSQTGKEGEGGWGVTIVKLKK